MSNDHISCSMWAVPGGKCKDTFYMQGIGAAHTPIHSTSANSDVVASIYFLMDLYLYCPISSEHSHKKDKYFRRLMQRNGRFKVILVMRAHVNFKKMTELKTFVPIVSSL